MDKAEGNPFFLEELTRAVTVHRGVSPTVAVPDTVQGVLMARIDRLADEPKRALQTAAVLGREFSLRLLEAIWEGSGVVTRALPELTRLEFLYERTGTDEPAYVFKHALTQDVAYQSLLTTHQRRLHAAAGRALERFYADRIDEVCDRLAYHYSNTAESEKAIDYLIRSADKAAGHYAHAEAVASIREALTHVEGLPAEARDRARVELTLRLGTRCTSWDASPRSVISSCRSESASNDCKTHVSPGSSTSGSPRSRPTSAIRSRARRAPGWPSRKPGAPATRPRWARPTMS